MAERALVRLWRFDGGPWRSGPMPRDPGDGRLEVASFTQTPASPGEPQTAADALALAADWAHGRRSWTNLGPYEPYTPDVVAAMDAQEVVKWGAMAQAMAHMEATSA